MVVIDEAHLRQLAALDLGHELVTTCYLDLDGRRLPGPADVESELQRILRDGRARAKGDASVLEDLRRIEAHVRGGIDRSDTRGLVMVCSSTASLWEAIPVPVSLRSQLVIGHGPALGQLEAMVHEAEVIATLVADQRRARLVVFQLGAPVIDRDVVTEVPDGAGDDERRAALVRHARAATQLLLDVHRDEVTVGAVVLGGSDEVVQELDRELHTTLAHRPVGRLDVDVDAAVADLRAEVITLETRREAERETALVSELRRSLAQRDGSVAGLPATLHALSAGRIAHLLVSGGYQAPGWRSPDGSVLAAVGPRCDLCPAMMVRADDVVEDAIELALHTGTRVTVLAECDDLDVLGHIGGLVRP